MTRYQQKTTAQVERKFRSYLLAGCAALAVGAVLNASPAMAQVGDEDLPLQCGWRWDSVSHHLMFNSPNAVAPGGRTPNLSQSGDYCVHFVPRGETYAGVGQQNWRWDSKSHNLVFGDRGLSPAGGAVNVAGSHNYVLFSDDHRRPAISEPMRRANATNLQAGWRWDSRSQNLMFHSPNAVSADGGSPDLKGDYLVAWIPGSIPGTSSTAVGPQPIPPSSCRTVANGVATNILNAGLSRLNPQIVIDHRNHAVGAHSLHPYTTGQNKLTYQSIAELGVSGGSYNLPDIPKIDRPRRIHFIQDLNTQSIRMVPDRDGVTIRASFETDGNELKGWYVASKVREADGRAADANILPSSGPLPFVDVKLSLDFDASRTAEPLRVTLRDVVVDMGVDANGVLEWFEPIIRPRLRDGVRDGIMNAWPQINAALTQAAGPALRDGFDIPGVGAVQLQRLSISGGDTTLCWTT